MPPRGNRARAWAVAGVIWLALPPAGAAASGPEHRIGIAMELLHVVDLRATHERAKIVMRARDAGIVIGDGSRPEALAARVHVEYATGATSGTLLVPGGTAPGWEPSGDQDATYSNREAPAGPSQAKRLTLRAGRRLKMVALGVGEVPLDIVAAGPPAGSVYVAIEVNDAGATTRLCAEMAACEHVPLGVADARLTCRDGVADPACHAARPVYRWYADVRYGGPATVAVLGDSITAQSEDPLRARLAEAGWYAHVNAKGSQMFRTYQDVAVRTAASSPGAAVLDFGTNDFGCIMQNFYGVPCHLPDFDEADLEGDARAMVAAFPSDTCVLGTTVWFGMLVNPVNALWHELAATGELRGIVPWAEHLLALPPAARDLLLADEIGHLTTAGVAALAALTADTVAAVCGS